jgi:hypothetical protein
MQIIRFAIDYDLRKYGSLTVLNNRAKGWEMHALQYALKYRVNSSCKAHIQIIISVSFKEYITCEIIVTQDLSMETVAKYDNCQKFPINFYHTRNTKVVVLYGCETWSLILREEHRLGEFENRVLRRIFGPRRDEVTGEWRKLHNEELRDLYSSPNIIRIIKSRRMRWAGHVARMGRRGTMVY